MHHRQEVQRALAGLNPCAVYHLAGAAHVGNSWQHTRETYEGNVVTILDARGDRCANEAHVSDRQISLSPEEVPGANYTGNPATRESEQ